MSNSETAFEYNKSRQVYIMWKVSKGFIIKKSIASKLKETRMDPVILDWNWGYCESMNFICTVALWVHIHIFSSFVH